VGIRSRRSVRVVGRSLLALTKPRIIELLLVTTVPTMMLAARGLPAAGLLMITLTGGALAAGSANTINCYLDRDIDAVMRRTSRRPLARPAPLAVIRPAEALAFGIGLGVAATLLLGLLANWLSGGTGRPGHRVLRVRIHAGAQAPDRLQHRHRRRRGVLPGAGGLGRGDRHGQRGAGDPLRGDLLLDAAPLLGAGHEVQGRLRGRPGADAAGRWRPPRWWPARSCSIPM
jgi:hypothetical protein